jgi:deoxycytidylate deaminase
LFEEEEDRPIMSKKIKKISNSNDYEKSSFKDIIEDMEDTKNVGLESLPKIRKEQVPSADETSKEILYGDGDKDDDNNK